MQGPEDSIEDEKSRGMIARAVEQIFQSCSKLKEQGWKYSMAASFLEVYNDALRDLLLPPNKASKLAIKQDNKDGSNEVVGLSSGMVFQKALISLPKSSPRLSLSSSSLSFPTTHGMCSTCDFPGASLRATKTGNKKSLRGLDIDERPVLQIPLHFSTQVARGELDKRGDSGGSLEPH
jgi:hypothetical protein